MYILKARQKLHRLVYNSKGKNTRKKSYYRLNCPAAASFRPLFALYLYRFLSKLKDDIRFVFQIENEAFQVIPRVSLRVPLVTPRDTYPTLLFRYKHSIKLLFFKSK